MLYKILLSLFLTCFLNVFSFAGTEMLHASANGDEITWTPIGDPSGESWQCFNSEDLFYAALGLLPEMEACRDLYIIEDTAFSTITSVTLTVYYADFGPGQANICLKSGESIYDCPSVDLYGTWEVLYIQEILPLSPFTDSAWTSEELNSLQVGIYGTCTEGFLCFGGFSALLAGSSGETEGIVSYPVQILILE